MQRFPLSAVITGFALLAATARADTIELSDAAVAALAKNPVVVPRKHANGKGFFIQGQIVVLRDERDQPTLPNPAKYFMFRPRKDFAALPGSVKEKPPVENSEGAVRLEWAWMRSMHHDIDTLEDVRGMISNRDLRYASGADALEALLAEIDPDGTLSLKKRPASPPAVADVSIVPREGWLSNYLINGDTSASERTAFIRRLRALPPEDPNGYSPINPLFWQMQGNVAVVMLAEGMARAEKFGEAEPGVRASCKAVAQFICERLDVSLDSLPAGAAHEKGMRIVGFSATARSTLAGFLVAAMPEGFAADKDANGKPTPPRATQRVSEDDDAEAITELDVARAMLDIIEGCPTPRAEDIDPLVSALVRCVASRPDCRAADTKLTIAPGLAAACDAIGARAFDVLLKLASAPESGVDFRQQLLGGLTENERPAVAMAAREVLARAGVHQTAEVESLVGRLFEIGTGFDGGDADHPVRANVAYVLRHLPEKTPDARLRSLVERRIADFVRQTKSRQTDGGASRAEIRLMELLSVAP